MQPAQLSLLPDQIPPPAPTVLVNLPEPETAEAVRQLGALLAKACKAEAAVTEATGEVKGVE